VDDAAGLRARLAELVRNENLRAEMGARAREIAVAEYGLESVARSYAEVYGEVLGAFSPPLKPPSPSTRTA
jgi:glycosyltransferase involved in cell wall biosynthesis